MANKMRAECMGDVLNLLDALPGVRWAIAGGNGYPDVIVTIWDVSSDTVMDALSDIPDAHRMMQTLETVDENSAIEPYPLQPE